MRAAILIAAALALGACGDNEAKGGAAGSAKASAADPVLEAWKKAGLTVSAFDPADGAAFGGDCRSGQVSGVDATICEYATPELAKAAQPKGLAAIGETTGASLANGKLLLVVADRRKADPEGRTINQATRTFLGKK